MEQRRVGGSEGPSWLVNWKHLCDVVWHKVMWCLMANTIILLVKSFKNQCENQQAIKRKTFASYLYVKSISVFGTSSEKPKWFQHHFYFVASEQLGIRHQPYKSPTERIRENKAPANSKGSARHYFPVINGGHSLDRVSALRWSAPFRLIVKRFSAVCFLHSEIGHQFDCDEGETLQFRKWHAAPVESVTCAARVSLCTCMLV